MSAYADVSVPLTRPLAPFPLRPYRPDGTVEPPLILIEGGEKTGKSWAAAEFTGDQRICRTWWIEWGEKPNTSYITIPGADYEKVPHDQTFWAVLSLIEQISVQARELISRDGAPLLVIDTMTAEWEALKALAHARTMASPSVQRKITANPAARNDPHPIQTNTWNDVTDLHYVLMHRLQHFPGIVMMIARGKEVTAFDDDGKPIAGEKAYRVEGHKNLGYDTSVWVRMNRDGKHRVHSCQSARAPLRPGIDPPQLFQGLSWLVWDILQYESKPWEPDLREQEIRQLAAGQPHAVDDWDTEITQADAIDNPAQRKEKLGELWNTAQFYARSGTVPSWVIPRITKLGHAAAEQIRLDAAQNAQDENNHDGQTIPTADPTRRTSSAAAQKPERTPEQDNDTDPQPGDHIGSQETTTSTEGVRV